MCTSVFSALTENNGLKKLSFNRVKFSPLAAGYNFLIIAGPLTVTGLVIGLFGKAGAEMTSVVQAYKDLLNLLTSYESNWSPQNGVANVTPALTELINNLVSASHSTFAWTRVAFIVWCVIEAILWLVRLPFIPLWILSDCPYSQTSAGCPLLSSKSTL